MKRSGFKRKPTKWDKIRSELKVKFEAAGITTCELHYPGCFRDNYLGFAHSKRRRHIVGDEIYEVILACNPCHDLLDSLPAEKTTEAVRSIISKRNVAVRPQ